MSVDILVVDDEPDFELLVRQKFRPYIRESKWSFSFASNGFEALDALKTHPEITLVLTDINMPGMDGLALLDEISRMDRLLRAIVVSAYGDMSNIRTAMNRGAFDFVTKPVDFDDLERTILKTLSDLERYQSALAAKERLIVLEKELNVARRIQKTFIPEDFPNRPDLKLFATLQPAFEVGGDFYDFFFIGSDKLGVVMGDVSGKGVSGALFMAITRTLLKAIATQGDPPAKCLSYVNHLLYPQSLSEVFVTVNYGILDLTSGQFDYVTAGHQPPYHIAAGGDVQSGARTGGIGLCMLQDFDYQSCTLQLAHGDTLFLYTDGVPEASDGQGNMFSEEGLERVLRDASANGPEQLVGAVHDAISLFTNGTAPNDDVTMMALTYLGT